MVDGLAVKGSSPRFFVDSDPSKTTLRALNDLKRYLIRTTVRREFNLGGYLQAFAC